MTDIVCTDPGHADRSGEPGWSAVLGTTDQDTAPSGVRCAACVAHDPPPAAPAPAALPDEIAAARAALAAATTILQVRSRTVALFDLLTTNQGDTP